MFWGVLFLVFVVRVWILSGAKGEGGWMILGAEGRGWVVGLRLRGWG